MSESAHGIVRRVQAACLGDRAAQCRLLNDYRPYVQSLAFRLIQDESEREDLVQEALTEALDHLGTLRSPKAFRPWLRAIVVNLVRNRWRHRKLLSGDPCPGVQPEPDVAWLAAPDPPPDVRVELQRVCDAIVGLPHDQRTVLVLTTVEGRSMLDVAATLGVSLATAKRRRASALSSIRVAVR